MLKKLKKDYLIRSYECDKNGELRLITLMNIFQDIADNHIADMGLGLDFCREQGLAWVGTNYHIHIDRLPKFHEKITVQTWPSAEKKLGKIRDFIVADSSGENIITASPNARCKLISRKSPMFLALTAGWSSTSVLTISISTSM